MQKAILYTCILLIIISCSKMDREYKKYVIPNGITYGEKVRDIQVQTGLNKVRFKFPQFVDPKVVKARIYWNNYSDSVDFAIPRNVDTIYYILPVPEGYYTFIIKTFDEQKNSSVAVPANGRSLGALFTSNMTSRPYSQPFVDNADGKLNLKWGTADVYNGSIGQKLTYTTKNDNINTLFLPATQNTTLISDYKPGTDLIYSTLYLADTASFDTLKTNNTTIVANSIVYKLNKALFREVVLDNDARSQYDYWGWYLHNIWDGRTNDDPGFHTLELPKPLHITVDLGTNLYSLYSFRTWQRTAWGTAFEGGGNMLDFALWGSNNPTQDGDWASWTKLGVFKASKNQVISEGELFIIPPGNGGYRYLRIQCLSLFNGKPNGAWQLMEIELMGKLAN